MSRNRRLSAMSRSLAFSSASPSSRNVIASEGRSVGPRRGCQYAIGGRVQRARCTLPGLRHGCALLAVAPLREGYRARLFGEGPDVVGVLAGQRSALVYPGTPCPLRRG
jgi:hypothetical protein